MDVDSSTSQESVKVIIKMLEPGFAKELYLSMQAVLPTWQVSFNENAIDIQKIETKVLAAYRDDQVVGLINIQLSKTTNAHIDLLFISESRYCLMITTKLLSAAENYCYEVGYSSLTLETLCDEKNESLYETLGYKPLFESYNRHGYLMKYLFKPLSLNDFIFVDLTHALTPDVPHWGVDPGFKYNARMIQTDNTPGGVQFRIQRLEMTAGIGTHMDAPSHCFEHATDISGIPLQSLITVCRVIDISKKANDDYSLSVDDVFLFEEEYGIIPKNAFVIVYTGWDQRWTQSEKYRNEKIFPNISLAAAELLLSRDIVGIGIDTLSPDAYGSDFPVHQLMLGSGKYIIENVANAKKLDPIGSFIIALPMKISDGTEAPMRLVGLKRKSLNVLLT